jgi:hypothetical protein
MSKQEALLSQTQDVIADGFWQQLAAGVAEIHRYGLWVGRRRANGDEFKTFHEFCTANQPHGLGVGQYSGWVNIETLHGLLQEHPEAQTDLLGEVAR